MGDDLEVRERADLSGWLRVRHDPIPFLSLGLCDESSLARALPILIGSAEAPALGGDSLVHLDVRSDNLYFVAERGREPVVLIDWNWCGRANADLDLMLWVTSLHAAGGPAPWEVVYDSKGLSALVSGVIAAQAGLPSGGRGARARQLQLSCLKSASPWVIKELSVPAPDVDR